MPKSTARYKLCALITVLLVLPLHAAEVPGSISGEFSVSRLGDARYSVPINVPAGAGGLAPQLELQYSSSRASGLAGQGWSLAGIGSVRRCPQTIAQDGRTYGVTHSLNDRFCLNGKRLMLVKGAYGEAGSEYRTELDSFYRITANGRSGAGPTSFTVLHPDGMSYVYGGNKKSRLSTASGTAKEWGLNLIEDKFGNRVSFYYRTVTDSAGNETEFVPDQITYADRSWQPQYKLILDYENRPVRDYRSGYLAGSLWEKSLRLKAISSFHDVSKGAGNYRLIQSYGFVYESERPNGSGRSRLSRLTLCGHGDCLPPLQFDWQHGEAGWGAPVGAVPDYQFRQFGDFNRDGKVDLLGASHSGNWQVHFSDGTGFGGAVPTGAAHWETFDESFVGTGHFTTVTDYNGDGRADHLYVEFPNKIKVAMADAANGFVSQDVASPDLVAPFSPLTADIDGDSLQDLIIYDSFYLNVSNQSGQGYGPENSIPIPKGMVQIAADSFYASPASMPVDIENDGKQNVVIPYLDADNTRHWYVVDLQAGVSKYMHMSTSSESTLTRLPRPVPIDINGDRLSDFLIYNGGAYWSVVISNGTGFLEPVPTPVDYVPGRNARGLVVVDYDLDGRSDILEQNSGRVYRSVGTNFDAAPVMTLSPVPEAIAPVDVSGDGYSDLVLTNRYVGHTEFPCSPCGVMLHNGSKADLLVGIEDSLGNRYAASYVSLSNAGSAVYSGAYEYGYPYDRTLKNSRNVVQFYDVSDGVGSDYRVSYKYYNAKQNTQGRNFSGFSKLRMTDSRSGLVVETRYLTSFPFRGRVKDKTVRQSRGGRKTYFYEPSWQSSTTHSSVEFVYLDSSQTMSYEVGGAYNGELVTITTVENEYDLAYGYRVSTESRVARADFPTWQYVSTEVVTPWSDAQRATWWCLRLPARVDITRRNPFGAAVTRSTTYADYQSDCKARSVIEGANEPASQQLVTKFNYDGSGNVATRSQDDADPSTSSASRETRYAYDPWRNRVAVEQRIKPGEDAHVVAYEWDDRFGLQSALTDVNGLSLRTSYDAFGRVKTIVRPDGSSTELAHQFCKSADCNAELAEYVVSMNSSDGAYSYIEYDAYRRPLGEYAGLPAMQGGESFVRRTYDNYGRVASETAPAISGGSELFSYFEYDLLNREVLSVEPLDDGGKTSTVITAYDRWQQTQSRDGGDLLISHYDALGRLIRLSESGANTYFKYTPFDELAEIRDSAGNKTTLGYNSRGFRVLLNDPDSGQWLYQYNAFGNLRFQSDDRPGNPRVMEYRYDRLGRMTERHESEGVTSWSYYPNTPDIPSKKRGQLKLVTLSSGDAQFAESYDYDSFSRLKKSVTRIDGQSFTVTRSYDDESRLLSLTYPEVAQPFAGYTQTAIYSYDDAGYLRQVEMGGKVLYQLHAVNGFGRETKALLGEESRRRSYYSATGLPKAFQAGLSESNSEIQNLRYTWSERRNLRSRTHLGTTDLPAVLSENFYYDEGVATGGLDKLTSVRLNGLETLRLSYDELGNIKFKSDVGGLFMYGEGDAGPHALTSIETEGHPNATTYSYDYNGNMLTRESSSNGIQWTSFAKPAVLTHGGHSSQFSYGPDRRRYRQIDDEKVIYYIGEIFQVEVEGSNIRSTTNVFANGEIVFVNQLQGFGAPGGWLQEWFVHRDHLGSVDTLTDGSGAVLQRFSYDAFGKRRNVDWSADPDGILAGAQQPSSRGFTGHEHLDKAGLIHMNGRLQDPVIGRFLSPDPLDPAVRAEQSINAYSYVSNNPLSLSDPSGYYGLDPSLGCTNIINESCVEAVRSNADPSARGFDAGDFDLKSIADQIAYDARSLDVFGIGIDALNSGIESAEARGDGWNIDVYSDVDTKDLLMSNSDATIDFARVMGMTGLAATATESALGKNTMKTLLPADATFGQQLKYLGKTHLWSTGRLGGRVTGFGGAFYDYSQYRQGDMSRGEFVLNIGITAYGMTGVFGATAASVYFIGKPLNQSYVERIYPQTGWYGTITVH